MRLPDSLPVGSSPRVPGTVGPDLEGGMNLSQCTIGHPATSGLGHNPKCSVWAKRDRITLETGHDIAVQHSSAQGQNPP